jgi:predicted  nucleic acid-binding Zn-ribbon protein
MIPECIECGDEYNPKRKELGYDTCLECGESRAEKEILRKSRCIAPAYNKGAYMYVSSSAMARDLGR